jgi:hypothetical protein
VAQVVEPCLAIMRPRGPNSKPSTKKKKKKKKKAKADHLLAPYRW